MGLPLCTCMHILGLQFYSIPTIYAYVHPTPHPRSNHFCKFKTVIVPSFSFSYTQITSKEGRVLYQNSPGMFQFVLIKWYYLHFLFLSREDRRPCSPQVGTKGSLACMVVEDHCAWDFRKYWNMAQLMHRYFLPALLGIRLRLGYRHPGCCSFSCCSLERRLGFLA